MTAISGKDVKDSAENFSSVRIGVDSNFIELDKAQPNGLEVLL